MLLLVLLAAIVTCNAGASLDEEALPYDGKVCMTVEPFRRALNITEFYECAPLSDEEVQLYNLTDKYLGIWVQRKCPQNFEFDETRQRCIDRKKLRRQQFDVPQCFASNLNPVVGNQCDWLSATLQPDPQSNAYFLQCAPQSIGQSCGEWVRMPCTPGTVFNPQTQICVPQSIIGTGAGPSGGGCISGGAPVCSCASQPQYGCPGATSCQQQSQVCCQPTVSASPALIQNQGLPVCIGSGAQPVASCSSGCPQTTQCQPNIGCCPQSVALSPSISITLCPDVNTLPVTSCSNLSPCPQGTSCIQSIGACCPNSRPMQQPSTIIQLCPGGTISQQTCGYQNQCPTGTGCFDGACCPMVCPQGQTPSGFCNAGGGGCSSPSTCYQPGGCCCSQLQMGMLPICPNGQVAAARCTIDLNCGAGLECSNGGCCPIPFCPNGIQATSRCVSGGVACNPGGICLGGLCCQLPSCAGGVQASGICTGSVDCGSGFECSNGGGCCPLPQCPNGGIATQSCGAIGCPGGQQCLNGACCPLPTCGNGIIAVSSCYNGFQCSPGFECTAGGGCCPLPVCPSGILASQRCQGGGGCSNSQMCWNGVCCPRPLCSTGQFATQTCGTGNSCQFGFICEGHGCCPEPLPLCPNGGRATRRCVRGSDCPPGFGCSHLNGCCPLSLALSVCPTSTNPVCQCSASNGCPAQSTCNMGTCCSGVVAAFNQNPGAGCQASTQCNGFGAQCSRCQQSTCVCVNGAWSNGVTCQKQPYTVLRKARSGCDQYGSGCRVFLSPARRKPLFAPIGNVTEQPLWYNVAKERRCISNTSIPDFDPDSTCLPSETCINGVCKSRLWPGEYGCLQDEECASRCPNTYCEPLKSDKGISQCQCKNGLLLYGRCFDYCPHGFHESGGYCMHDDDEAFWSDGNAQDRLNDLLNAGKC